MRTVFGLPLIHWPILPTTLSQFLSSVARSAKRGLPADDVEALANMFGDLPPGPAPGKALGHVLAKGHVRLFNAMVQRMSAEDVSAVSGNVGRAVRKRLVDPVTFAPA